MILGQTQEFASPEEALEHYGVKGMRWGVRNEDDPVGRARANVQAKQQITEARTTKNVVSPNPTPGQSVHQHIGGLTPTQKKILIGVGVTAVAVGGYYAYRHYAGATLPRPSEHDVSALAKGPLSKLEKGGLTAGHASYQLKHPEKLMVDISKGYADIRSTDGFANVAVKNRHGEMLRTLESFREKYPVLRNMNVEVVPMSHVPGMEGMIQSKTPAAVMAMGKGEARVIYNDVMDALNPTELAYVKSWQPGITAKDFLGHHEMGHLLAVAHGEMPPATALFEALEKNPGAVRPLVRHKLATNEYHKELFKKHGLSYRQLRKLSKYAGTEPAEALAELAGHFHTPEFRAKMDPATLAKAEALFNDMGGVTG